MKRILYFMMMAILTLAIVGCGSSKAADSTPAPAAQSEAKAQAAAGSDKKILVAYFSWGGKTRGFAEELARQSGADIFEITPAVPYPSDYRPTTEVAKAERENNARPKVANKVENMAQYDVVFVGYPIWWHDTPKLIDTFMESYDFSGKTVIPFATSGGSSFDESWPTMQKLAKDAKLEKGILISTRAQIPNWLDKLGLRK